MNKTWIITKRELKSFFDSPLAYMFIILFLLITGYLTWFYPSNIFASQQASLGTFFNFTFWEVRFRDDVAQWPLIILIDIFQPFRAGFPVRVLRLCPMALSVFAVRARSGDSFFSNRLYNFFEFFSVIRVILGLEPSCVEGFSDSFVVHPEFSCYFLQVQPLFT